MLLAEGSLQAHQSQRHTFSPLTQADLLGRLCGAGARGICAAHEPAHAVTLTHGNLQRRVLASSFVLTQLLVRPAWNGVPEEACQNQYGCCYMPAPTTIGEGGAALHLPLCFKYNTGNSAYSLAPGSAQKLATDNATHSGAS